MFFCVCLCSQTCRYYERRVVIVIKRELGEKAISPPSRPHLTGWKDNLVLLVEFSRHSFSASVFLVEIDENLVVVFIDFGLQFPIGHRLPGIGEDVVFIYYLTSSTAFAFFKWDRIVASEEAFIGNFSRTSRMVRVGERPGKASGPRVRRQSGEENERSRDGE